MKNKIKEFLLRIERRFHFDATYVAMGGFWLFMGQAISLAAGLALTVIFANFLEKSVYGTYSYVLSIVGILTVITLPGMDAAIVRSTAAGAEGAVRAGIKARMRWGILAGATALLFGFYYLFQENTTLAISLFIAAVFIPVMDPLSSYGDFLKGRKKFNIQTKYAILTQIIAALSIAVAIIFFKNLFAILAAYFISYTAAHFIFSRLTFKRFPPNLKTDSEMIAFGKHLTVLQAITAAANYIDRILIFHFLGAAPLAIYSIALAPVKRLEGIFMIIPQLALPKLAARPTAEIKASMKHKVVLIGIAAAITAGFYALAAPFLFRLFFPQYGESVIYSQFYALVLLIAPFNLVYAFFQSKAMVNILYRYKIVTQGAQVAIVGLLTYFFGISGAVTSKIIFYFLSIPIILFFFKKATTQQNEIS